MAAEKRAKRFEIFVQVRETFKDVPPEEIEAEVAKALAEVRAESRAQQPAVQEA